MDFTHVPESLLYKRKSLDKLAMLHPLNAAIIKQLLKMEGWNRNVSREGCIITCMNNAYYICTMMRLEFDATFREYSYQSIARDGHIEESNTRLECVTLSLVALLIEHSTSEWRTKLQDVANDLRRYAMGLQEVSEYELLGRPGKKYHNVCDLSGIPQYLENGVQSSWILPDDLFLPRVIDDNAILDLIKYNSSFKWDCWLYHRDEEEMHELIENIGKTQQEKAKLINWLWHDIYFSRKAYNGPIKSTWISLHALAEEFCPDCIEKTELHKIPDSGLDINKHSHELEEEVKKLKEENTKLKETHQNQSNIEDDGNQEQLSGEEELTLRERLVFFFSVLSLDNNKKYTVLSNLGKFISVLCNDPKNVVSFISRMKKPEEAAANAKAAKKVAELMKLIIPKEYRNDEKLTINKLINSMLLNFPDKEE